MTAGTDVDPATTHPLVVVVQDGMSHEAAVACTARAAADACPITITGRRAWLPMASDAWLTADAATLGMGRVAVRTATLRQIRRLFEHAHTNANRAKVAVLDAHRVMVIAPNPVTAFSRPFSRLAPTGDLRRDTAGYYNQALADLAPVRGRGAPMSMAVDADLSTVEALANAARLGFRAPTLLVRPGSDAPGERYYPWASVGFRTSVTVHTAPEIVDLSRDTTSGAVLLTASDAHGACRTLLTGTR